MTKHQDMYERTLEIGKMKLAEGSEAGRVVGPRIGTGGGFPGIFLWDTAFCIFWMRYTRRQIRYGRTMRRNRSRLGVCPVVTSAAGADLVLQPSRGSFSE